MADEQDDLNELSVRARKTLARLGIQTWATLAAQHSDALRAVKNCGPTTICELRNALAKRGLSFFGEPAIAITERCCGRTLDTPFCPFCGKPNESPLCDLLAWLRKRDVKVSGRAKDRYARWIAALAKVVGEQPNHNSGQPAGWE